MIEADEPELPLFMELNKQARSGPPRGLEKKKCTSIRKYKWRNTSESHTDKLDQKKYGLFSY